MAHFQVSSASLTPSRPAPSPAQPKLSSDPFSLASAGYNSSFTTLSSFNNNNYSGIGSAPSRGNSADEFSGSRVVRSGNASIKEDGFASWLWKAKWLVLTEQVLSIHKNEVSSLFPSLLRFFGDPCISSHRHNKPSFFLVTSQTSSAQTSSPIVSFWKQRIRNTGYHSRTMKRSMDGRMISIHGALSWALVIPQISSTKSMLVSIRSLAISPCVPPPNPLISD
jgi:hypothetical protein